MNKTVKIILGIIIAIFLVMVGLKCLSNEDDWICQDGEWVKHGYPSAPKPTTPCD